MNVPNTIKVEIEVNAEERESWINDFALNSDAFSRSACGYWMAGVDQDESLGWLVFEFEADDAITFEAVRAYWNEPKASEHNPEPELDPAADPVREIVALWRAGKELPKCWYRLDRAAAERAYAFGAAKHGEGFADGTCDATDYDCAIQRALLGEVRYG